MDLDLSGKVAVVTGASKGIGLAVTSTLAREGVRVAAGARAITEELTALAASSQVQPISVDLTQPDGPTRFVNEAISAYGGPDILVNNVGGVRPRVDGFLSITDDDWSSTFAINLFAAVRTTQSWVRAASGSTWSVRDRWPLGSGLEATVSPRPSRAQWAVNLMPSQIRPPRMR
jgi:NAD(P)-dependent dehydrogenase (short-subunit alcohol dehydrogenase family)